MRGQNGMGERSAQDDASVKGVLVLVVDGVGLGFLLEFGDGDSFAVQDGSSRCGDSVVGFGGSFRSGRGLFVRADVPDIARVLRDAAVARELADARNVED